MDLKEISEDPGIKQPVSCYHSITLALNVTHTNRSSNRLKDKKSVVRAYKDSLAQMFD